MSSPFFLNREQLIKAVAAGEPYFIWRFWIFIDTILHGLRSHGSHVECCLAWLAKLGMLREIGHYLLGYLINTSKELIHCLILLLYCPFQGLHTSPIFCVI